jgi:hypothetical protein
MVNVLVVAKNPKLYFTPLYICIDRYQVCNRDFFLGCKVKKGLTMVGVFLEGTTLTF